MKKQRGFSELERYKHDPEKIQRKILKGIINNNRNSGFGKEFGFDKMRSYEDFAQKVPVRTSKQYLGYLDEVYQGQDDALTSEAPYFFAMTTGTTGQYKNIPITKSYKKETDNSMMAFLYFLEKAYPETQHAPIQFLVGSGDGGTSPGGKGQGFVSGFNYKNFPKVITKRFVIPYWVFTIENVDDRYYAMARFMIDSPGFIGLAAVSPLAITMVVKSVLSHLERLAFDLTHNKLTLDPQCQHLADEHQFHHHPDKLAALKAYQSGDPVVPLMDQLLPKLKYLVCWSGGNMSYALAECEKYLGKKQLFEMPFSASEGTFGVPFVANSSANIAAITGHFLEFIPEDEIDDENPSVLPVWSLEFGKTYYLVITTSSGLYRYNMEDLIEVTGFWCKVPVIEFVSKRARQVSISNEQITERDVVETTKMVCAKLNIHFDQFVYFPCQQGYYTLVVGSTPTDMSALAQMLDDQLRVIAKGYDIKRSNKVLAPLQIAVVDNAQLNGFMRTIQFNSKLPNGQFKPMHLSTEFNGQQQFRITNTFTSRGLHREQAID